MAKRTIIISEKMEKALINRMIEESVYYPDPEKVIILKAFLDKNFTKENVPDVNGNGLPSSTMVASMKNQNGVAIETMKPIDLFYFMQERFKNIEPNENDRDRLLRQVLKDWFGNKISKEGGLSVNYVQWEIILFGVFWLKNTTELISIDLESFLEYICFGQHDVTPVFPIKITDDWAFMKLPDIEDGDSFFYHYQIWQLEKYFFDVEPKIPFSHSENLLKI